MFIITFILMKFCKFVDNDYAQKLTNWKKIYNFNIKMIINRVNINSP